MIKNQRLLKAFKSGKVVWADYSDYLKYRIVILPIQFKC